MGSDSTGLFDLDFTYDNARVPPAPPSPPTAEPPPVPAPPPVEEPPAPTAEPPAVPQMSGFDQFWAAVRVGRYKARRTWRDARANPRGPIGVIEHFQPPSIGGSEHTCTACGHVDKIPGQIQYRDGRGWVPDGHPGGWSDRWGVRYHTWFAIPVLSWLNTASFTVERPFRMGVFLAILGLVVAFILALISFGWL